MKSASFRTNASLFYHHTIAFLPGKTAHQATVKKSVGFLFKNIQIQT
jgi:hypothetical protein